MSLKENSSTYKPLPIKLDLKWSEHLPLLAWRGYFLSDSKSSESHRPVLNLDHLHFAEVLDIAFIQLDYAQFLFAIHFLKSQPGDFETQKLALEAQTHFRWNEESDKLHSLLTLLPQSFMNWLTEKKLAFNDLRPLLRVQVPPLAVYLEKIAELNPSKSIGTALLESLCDLNGNGQINQISVDLIESSKKWLEQMIQVKNPKTSTKDMKRKETVRKWPWPPRMSGEWKRWGDQAGLEVQLNCLTPEDLNSKILKLNEILKKWQEELP